MDIRKQAGGESPQPPTINEKGVDGGSSPASMVVEHERRPKEQNRLLGWCWGKPNMEWWCEGSCILTVQSCLVWMPKRCRWDPVDPPKFNMGLNFLFAFVSGCALILQGMLHRSSKLEGE